MGLVGGKEAVMSTYKASVQLESFLNTVSRLVSVLCSSAPPATVTRDTE